MVAILFPKQSAPGPDTQESAGRLVNAISLPTQQGAGSDNIIRRVPGLRVFSPHGANTPRGFKRVGDYLFAAFEGSASYFDLDGTGHFIGSLEGARPVDFAVNNRAPIPDLVCVTEYGAYIVTDVTITAYTDADLPQPNSVCELDGYFIFSIADGRMFSSDLNSTAVNSLNFARAEARQGGLVRVVSYNGQLFAFKRTSCEVWSNTGNPTGFPLSRAAVVDRGLLANRAIAGTQEGFSTTLIWVGDDGAVNALDGYQATPISTIDVERAIARLANKEDMRAHVYMMDGQPIWSLSSPEFTWEYNLRTGAWHERRSETLERWRGAESVYFNGQWLCGDLLSNNVMEITTAAYDEAGDAMIFEAESIQMSGFPRPYRVGKTSFDMTVGLGRANGTVPIETSPVALIEWSDDAGRTWSQPMTCLLGEQGEGRTQVVLPRRMGRTSQKGRRWRVRVSDPVHVGLYGGDMEVMQGRA